jgi:hypothetical protein
MSALPIVDDREPNLPKLTFQARFRPEVLNARSAGLPVLQTAQELGEQGILLICETTDQQMTASTIE